MVTRKTASKPAATTATKTAAKAESKPAAKARKSAAPATAKPAPAPRAKAEAPAAKAARKETGEPVELPTGEARYRWIAHAAYLRAERRGFAPGHEFDDWLAAEAEFREVHKLP